MHHLPNFDKAFEADGDELISNQLLNATFQTNWLF